MASKVFVSYKYSDNQVWQGLDNKYWAVEENPLTGEEIKVGEATGRAYVNYLQEVIGKENINKGEKEDESLEGKTDEQIWEILKPRIHDSTVTLVVISKGMKDLFENENNQWIPTEIRYSLWEITNGGKRSAMNALLGVIIPDCDNTYNYVWGASDCEHCKHIKMFKKDYLFRILYKNVFNRKNDNGKECSGPFCSSRIYTGEHSYLHLVNFDEFISNHQVHIDKALKIQGNRTDYNVEREI